MTNQTLFAKSKKNGRQATLQEHLFDAEKAAELIFRFDRRWGQNWCRFFKINDSEAQEKFLLHLRIAALFHDIGKANEEFQNLVTNRGKQIQTIRHEHLSALILHLPEVRGWLAENQDLDLEIITAAVLSHHLKSSEKQDCQWKWGQPKGKFTLTLYDSYDEVNAIFDRIQEVAGLSKQLRLSRLIWEAEKSPWTEALQAGFCSAIKLKLNLKKDENSLRLKLLLAVKAGLIVADAAASGLVRVGHEKASFVDWIDDKVLLPPIEENEISETIINQRGEKILEKQPEKKEIVERKKLSGASLKEALNEVLWRDFQKEAETLGRRALLLTACASGKTIAGWKWAEAQARENKEGISKVIFLYPTRGTATEGFKDYVGYAPEDEAGLLFSTAKYELEGIAKNPTDVTAGKTYQTEDEEKLFALGFWGKKYFSATVDQFLSFLEHGYSSLCLLPVLADSAVIIDEVHSFDKRMFENLICFLKTFDVPVLCMTATLPQARRRSFESLENFRVYPNKDEFEKLEDLKKAENRERYNLEFTDDEDAALEIAVAEYEAGNRVLWVVNTVQRCQRIAVKLKNRLKLEPFVYHSRYTFEDRRNRHSDTVNAFKQIETAQIAVTTQVCEMSLDLDADVLISEFAPIPSLVQRFGRANRHLAKGDDFRARLVVYNPREYKIEKRFNPYDKNEIENAETFLRDLPEINISQHLLAEKLEEHVLKERKTTGEFAAFLTSGYFAVREDFRDIEEFTNPCVLSADIGKVKKCLDEKKPYDAFVVNVPMGGKKDETPIWILDENVPGWLPKHLKIADSRYYRKHYGFVPDLGLLEEMGEDDE